MISNPVSKCVRNNIKLHRSFVFIYVQKDIKLHPFCPPTLCPESERTNEPGKVTKPKMQWPTKRLGRSMHQDTKKEPRPLQSLYTYTRDRADRLCNDIEPCAKTSNGLWTATTHWAPARYGEARNVRDMKGHRPVYIYKLPRRIGNKWKSCLERGAAESHQW